MTDSNGAASEDPGLAKPDGQGSEMPRQLSMTGCILILIVAFLGWGFAGVHMSINSIVMRVAPVDLLPAGTAEGEIGQWFGWLTCAFLLGAATGGYLFGIVGDRFGRAKAMAASILCYSLFSGATYFVQTPEQLWVLRFLTCLGIGGMWPNGIALMSEAWSNVSRPMVAGVIGTAANVGILVFALVTVLGHQVTVSDWRWTFIVGASPVVLGIFSLLLVPESPRWLALKRRQAEDEKLAPKTSIGEVFRPPILKTTLIGILLGAIPLFGGWGVSNWATAWASEKGDTVKKQASADDAAEKQTAAKSDKPDPILKSMTVVARSLPGSISSLLGGILAFWLGRKKVYVLLCIGALICTQGLFRVENPIDSQVLFTISMFNRELAITSFLAWTFGLGFFSGFFFGWLPLCLPEMFPTRLRATGAGVTFNWGRILTAVGILLSAVALKELFKGRYAEVGKITGFVYAFGLIVIWFAPIKSGKKELDD